MNRAQKRHFIALLLLFGNLECLAAQTPSVDQFLRQVDSKPVKDEIERDQSLQVGEIINSSPSASVERIIPTLLDYSRAGHSPMARKYATLFLNAVAIRPDGAQLLAPHARDVADLIDDPDPGIQKVAVVVTDFVLTNPATDKDVYGAALARAIEARETPQGTAVEMLNPFLYLHSSGARLSTAPVSDFLHRDNLTPDSRRELLHSLGSVAYVPDDVTLALVNTLSDPDLTVRAAAVVAFAQSRTAFHTLGEPRVKAIVEDPQENAQLRVLAKDALAGKTALDPNINLPPQMPKN